MPKPFKNGRKYYKGYNDEEWAELDEKICNLTKEAVNEIMNATKNRRIVVKQIVKK